MPHVLLSFGIRNEPKKALEMPWARSAHESYSKGVVGLALWILIYYPYNARTKISGGYALHLEIYINLYPKRS